MPVEYKWALFFVAAIAVFTFIAWAATKQKPPGFDITGYHKKRGKR